MSKLSTQTIQRARSGSRKCLDELSSALTAENYALAVLDAALEHLHLEDLPKGQLLILFHDRLQRALSAVRLVYSCLVKCGRETPLARPTTSRIQKHFDSLLAWMTLIIKGNIEPTAYATISTLILRMVFHDDAFSLPIYSSPHALNLALKLWQYELVIDDHVLDTLAEGSPPPNTVLIYTFLVHQDGAQIFGDLVASSKRRLSAFLDALLLKLKRLTGLLQENPTNSGATSLRTKRSLCLKELVALTSLFASLVSPSERFLDGVASLLQIAKSNRCLGLVVNSGLLEALVKLYPSCQWGDERGEKLGRYVLTFLASAACYPKILKSLGNVTSNIRALLEVLKLDTKSNLWFRLVQHITNLSSLLPSVGFGILNCDNDCSFSSRLDESSLCAKICTGCYFMTYCSVQCQKDDWSRRHRLECAELRQRTQGYYGNARVSQHAKAFYLSLAKTLFHNPNFKQIFAQNIDEGKDVVVGIRTGAGKTLSFWLPLTMALDEKEKNIMIVVTPLNLLGKQNEAELKKAGISAIAVSKQTANANTTESPLSAEPCPPSLNLMDAP
ncbi:hypothetical protein BKA70DRAFT_1481875 [Coprinopsis sp. MPI-PUGE-AT-0042]|nr:hypothetical protein BKA70DRAFT_1481875 [Coprinopsis sp. MPI-PUGE-AT-0042]